MLKSLLVSRRFWIAVIAIATSAIMLATKQISGPQFEAAVIATLASLKIALGLDPARDAAS